ncbi:hypothetical protein HAX54_034986 [Datura stramonium]|uniref:Uncharacterized protein n=1 Tax=Datura stramonium TaxID=4076 RepID=A0ABS8VES9_DATST|nr:hypothetical protein [Datura stramonium]
MGLDNPMDCVISSLCDTFRLSLDHLGPRVCIVVPYLCMLSAKIKALKSLGVNCKPRGYELSMCPILRMSSCITIKIRQSVPSLLSLGVLIESRASRVPLSPIHEVLGSNFTLPARMDKLTTKCLMNYCAHVTAKRPRVAPKRYREPPIKVQQAWGCYVTVRDQYTSVEILAHRAFKIEALKIERDMEVTKSQALVDLAGQSYFDDEGPTYTSEEELITTEMSNGSFDNDSDR